jgi:hypothetical protein
MKINLQEIHFMREYCLLNNIYMTGEMPEEWRNNILIPTYTKGDKKVENYRVISLLNACYKI